jgi:Ca2+-binding RTX toxin-like protein
MPSRLALRNCTPFVRVDEEGNIIEFRDYKSGTENSDKVAQSSVADVPATVASHSDRTISGSLSGTEDGDVYQFNLVAGQTYTFAYRGTVTDGIEDPYLVLYDPTGTVALTEDDDGGAGRTSMISFTPVTSGAYLLRATSWYTIEYGDPSLDTGNYTIDVWSPDPAHDASDTLAGAATIGLGTTFGNFEEGGDVDVYSVQMTEGTLYTFGFAGGIAGDTDMDIDGEAAALLELIDSSGTVIASSLDYESGISHFAGQSGTYYIRVTPYLPITGEPAPLTGGYTIDIGAVSPDEHGPLESIDWKSAGNVPFIDTDGDGVGDTATVYFGKAGENFGETGDNGVEPLVTYGWQPWQIEGVMNALKQYEQILGVKYVITDKAEGATFRLATSISDAYGAYMYPRDPAYGTQQGIGVFNLISGGFGTRVESMQQGGYSFAVVLHEFGHAHGLAHPHDTGGGSAIMLGVTAPTGSYGVYDLNQGVYTVMSYNDAWDKHPDGPSPYSGTGASIGYGWSGSLSAFDVAQLQERYGVHAANAGDTVYMLDGVNAPGTFYQTIWDTGGNDTIAFSGSAAAQIDLLGATLDYSAIGGGVVSFVDNVWGGYTIAHGVVIENATGGSGNDTLLGNEAANTLTGNAGNDTLVGRGGSDLLLGGDGADRVMGGDGLDVVTLGAGNDILVAEIDPTKIDTKQGKMSVDIITDFDAAGDDVIDLSGLGEAFNFRGTNNNKYAGDLTFKSYNSVSAAERALGIDIDGNPGAGGIGGPVTIVFGNIDGHDPDFALVLLNTRNVSADDFLMGAGDAFV